MCPAFRGFLLASALILILPAAGFRAQDMVEEVTVTGRPYSLDSPSRHLEVITAAEIRELGVSDLAALLERVGMLHVSRRGPGAASFDLCMRGGNFEQVLVLVNGVPFNHSQTGHLSADFPFSVNDIERIEVLKGGAVPARASGAFAGTVNVILKSSQTAGFSLLGGAHGLVDAGLSLGAAGRRLQGRVSLGYRDTDGYYPGRESRGTTLNGGMTYHDAGFRVDLFGGAHLRRFGAAGFYGPFPSLENTSGRFAQIHAQKRFAGLVIHLRAASRRHEDDFILDRVQPEIFTNHSVTWDRLVSLVMDWSGADVRSFLGVEYRIQVLDSSGMGNRKREIPALSAGFSLTPGGGAVDMDFGLRLEMLNGRPAGVLHSGLHVRISPRLVARANLSRSLRHPSFTELYYVSPANRGDPGLRPETSLNLESSLEYRLGAHLLVLTGFLRRRGDLIDWVRPEGNAVWSAVNLADHTLAGLEFFHNLRLEKVTLQAGLEHLFCGRLDAPGDSKYGLRFPDLAFKVTGTWRPVRTVRLVCRYTWKRILNTSQRGHLLDLAMAWRFGRRLEMVLHLDNLLDTRMEEIPGVPVAGRWLYASISFH